MIFKKRSLMKLVDNENTEKYGPEKTPQGYDQKLKLLRTNSFVLAHSSAKKIYNEQLTLKYTMQWYHMTECDVI